LLNGNILTGDQRELRIVNYELRMGFAKGIWITEIVVIEVIIHGI